MSRRRGEAECSAVISWFSGDIFNDDNTQGMTVDDTCFLFIYILDGTGSFALYRLTGWAAYMEMEVFRASRSL
jgi:hypothetical protein